MPKHVSGTAWSGATPIYLVLGSFCLLFLFSLSCAVLPTSGTSNQSVVDTQTALSVQLTLAAANTNQSNINLAQAQEATQIALDAQATMLAVQTTQQSQQAVVPTSNSETTPITPATSQELTPTTENTADFEAWMKSAKILLYEDITGNTYATRYIKEVLDKMGLTYTDVEDKSANLINEIKSGGPGGKGWDLVIAASENRLGGTAGFIQEINDAIKSGSAVIIEHWNLDEATSKQVAPIYSQCGIAFQYEWGPLSGPIPIGMQVLYPIDATSPILHEPNDNISMSKITDFWGEQLWGRVKHMDYGDLLQKNPGSKAIFILGTKPEVKDKYGTLISCLDGRLILQTFATHNYRHENAILLWENVIYNTLKSRFNSLGK